MLPAFLTSGLFILYIRYLYKTLFVIAKHLHSNKHSTDPRPISILRRCIYTKSERLSCLSLSALKLAISRIRIKQKRFKIYPPQRIAPPRHYKDTTFSAQTNVLWVDCVQNQFKFIRENKIFMHVIFSICHRHFLKGWL